MIQATKNIACAVPQVERVETTCFESRGVAGHASCFDVRQAGWRLGEGDQRGRVTLNSPGPLAGRLADDKGFHQDHVYYVCSDPCSLSYLV